VCLRSRWVWGCGLLSGVWMCRGRFRSMMDLTFRIRSVPDDYSLQVRVRAAGHGDGSPELFGDWSPWRILSARWLNDACRPAAILADLKHGRAATEVGEWTAAAVGTVAAIRGAVTGAATGSAARHSLTRAATELAAQASQKPAPNELMTAAINDLADGATDTTEAATVRLMFDCVGHGAGLTRTDAATVAEETLREHHRTSPELSDINIDTAIENHRTLTSESTRSQGRN